MRYSLTVAALVAFQTASGLAAAQRGDSSTTTPDKAQGTTAKPSEETKPSRWKGSTVAFDQSATTTTLGLGKSYQSSDQTYELWVPLRPRYLVYESESKWTSVTLNGWANVFLELTNSATTTTEHEPVLGSTFFWASLSQTIFESNGYKTSLSLGPRLTLPTDKESRSAGRFGALGALGGISQTIPLAGKGAPAFNSMRLGISTIYGHALNRFTTPINSNIRQDRQDVAGRLIVDDQLRFGMNVRDTVNLSFSGGLQITPKLSLGLVYVIINSWTYWPTPAQLTSTATGPVDPQSIDNPTNHRVSTWALASIDYEALDEMSVGVGYYNLTNQIGPDGTRRNPLWSPDARIFLTATANLDVIFSHFGSSKPAAQTAAKGTPATQTAATPAAATPTAATQTPVTPTAATQTASAETVSAK